MNLRTYKPKNLKTRLFVIMLISTLAGSAQAVPALRVSVGHSGSDCRKVISRDLKTYLGKLFTNPVEFSDSGAQCDIVIGTPATNPLVEKAVASKKITLPDGPNADQGYTVNTIGDTIWVVGSTEQGALYGVYELLEQYGAYFQIDGERLPAKRDFEIKQLDIRKSPTFKYRGLLPWDNFACGMSGWDLQQYQELIDRGTRMKFNMLQFHFYAGEAFFTETVNGETTQSSCIGSPVDVFRTKGSVGESAFKGVDMFGPRPYVDNLGNPRKQAEAVQAMMRKVIDHAHTRGWVSCVGFELMAATVGNPSMTDKPDGDWNSINPLDPRNVDISLQRYRSLVKTYPNSDFYWMWQSEGRGVLSRHVGREPGAAEMRKEFARWSQDDLVGDIDYAYLFREVANKLTPDERKRLGTGGWGVEHLFPGIDPDFPKEIIFASLNSYYLPEADKRQVPCYRVAKDGRRAWMIEWWEFDGNQWFPQFRVGWQEKMYKKCAEYGVEAVTLLGWKLSGVEHNVRYLADFSWNPKLTGAQFYKDYLGRLCGKDAESLADVYLDYDRYEESTPPATPADFRPMLLSAGWMPLAIPSLPQTTEGLNEPAWRDTISKAAEVIAQQQKLLEKDQQSALEVKQTLPKLDKQGKSFARLMLNRLEFRALYVQSMLHLNQSLIDYDKAGREQGMEKAGAAAATEAKLAVEQSRMAIEKYAEEVRNRGDQGVIAQMNEQYFSVVKNHYSTLRSANTTYATLDWGAFRLRPTIKFDFTRDSVWPHRDGKNVVTSETADGKPALKLEIPGGGAPGNSVFIHNEPIDLDESPCLDFRIRTSSTEPLAMMFQMMSGDTWFALNLMGTQRNYTFADALPAGSISNGEWHRVTWNLRELVKDRTGGGDSHIRSVILGTWESLKEPVVVEFSDFAFGKRNMLD
jgi:hypothetical protein